MITWSPTIIENWSETFLITCQSYVYIHIYNICIYIYTYKTTLRVIRRFGGGGSAHPLALTWTHLDPHTLDYSDPPRDLRCRSKVLKTHMYSCKNMQKFVKPICIAAKRFNFKSKIVKTHMHASRLLIVNPKPTCLSPK